MMLPVQFLQTKNTIKITLLFVLLHYTARNCLVARYALDFHVKELCIIVGVLNGREGSVPGAVSEVASKLAREMAKDKIDRSSSENVESL